jgi:hypothetical protein
VPRSKARERAETLRDRRKPRREMGEQCGRVAGGVPERDADLGGRRATVPRRGGRYPGEGCGPWPEGCE